MKPEGKSQEAVLEEKLEERKKQLISETDESKGNHLFEMLDDILDSADDLVGVMIYFVVLSFFLVLVVVYGALGFPKLNDWIGVPFAVYAFFVVIFFPIELWKGIRLIRPLRNWLYAFGGIAYVTIIELFPPCPRKPLLKPPSLGEQRDLLSPVQSSMCAFQYGYCLG